MVDKILFFESDFGVDNISRPSAKLRRMSKRQLKKHMRRLLNRVWGNAVITSFQHAPGSRMDFQLESV